MNSGSRHAAALRPPHLSGVICMRPTSPPPPMVLGLQVDSWRANDARRMAGRPVSAPTFSKTGTSDLHGSQTWLVARACSSETVVMRSSVTPAGGVQPDDGLLLSIPQLSHERAPLG